MSPLVRRSYKSFFPPSYLAWPSNNNEGWGIHNLYILVKNTCINQLSYGQIGSSIHFISSLRKAKLLKKVKYFTRIIMHRRVNTAIQIMRHFLHFYGGCRDVQWGRIRTGLPPIYILIFAKYSIAPRTSKAPQNRANPLS